MSPSGSTRLTAEDRGDIANLYALYCRTIDRCDVEGWVDCYSSDGIYCKKSLTDTMVVTGKQELLAFAEGVVQRRGEKYLHIAADIVLEEDGGDVMGSCVMVVFDTSAASAPFLSSVGVYEDRLKQDLDGWRFVSRTVVVR